MVAHVQDVGSSHPSNGSPKLIFFHIYLLQKLLILLFYVEERNWNKQKRPGIAQKKGELRQSTSFVP